MHMTTSIQVVRSAKESEERLTELPALQFEAATEDAPAIVVDTGKQFQTMEGFGGAFTEAAASVFYKLSPANRAEILKAYFDPQQGHGYNLCRTHINSCDFALGNYAYTEVPGDTSLEHFSIERDRKQLIPLIKEAFAVAGGPFKLFASPWSPPAWMKTTGQMNHGGKLKPEYRDAWARYYCRYISEYEREGIPIWGLSIQNEPMAVQTWDSCIYSAEEERDFVRDHLGPVLHREGRADVKVIIWDHNRDVIFERASVMYDDPEAAKYVWGTGFHWYNGDHFDNLQMVHDCYPDKALIFTEGCQENGPHIGSWALGERYARSVIHDLNRWTVAWVDWNILLDERGGPNHVGNYCSAPIIADTVNDKVLYQSSYYYLGHFARYIRPGARRVVSASSHDDLETTAFVNPDGQVVVVVLNRSEQSLPFLLRSAGKQAQCESLPHSIMTLRFAQQ
jgi:glucosylceramidase